MSTFWFFNNRRLLAGSNISVALPRWRAEASFPVGFGADVAFAIWSTASLLGFGPL